MQTITEEDTKMLESRTSAGATEKSPGWENLTQRRWHGPTIWKDMLDNALSDTASWQTKSGAVFQSVKSFLDDHHFKKQELQSVGQFAQVGSNCLEMLVYGTNWWA